LILVSIVKSTLRSMSIGQFYLYRSLDILVQLSMQMDYSHIKTNSLKESQH